MKKSPYQFQSFAAKRFLWSFPVIAFLFSLTAGSASAGDLGIKQLRVRKSIRDCNKKISVVVKVKNYGPENAYGKVKLTGIGTHAWGNMHYSLSKGGTKTLVRDLSPPFDPGNVTWEVEVITTDSSGNPVTDDRPSNNTKSAATNFLCVR